MIHADFFNLFWPATNSTNPVKQKLSIMVTIGMLVELKKIPTRAEANAPSAIWMAPISAAALPACRVKGAIAMAAALGKMKP